MLLEAIDVANMVSEFVAAEYFLNPSCGANDKEKKGIIASAKQKIVLLAKNYVPNVIKASEAIINGTNEGVGTGGEMGKIIDGVLGGDLLKYVKSQKNKL